ncbi:MAG: cytochrome C [Proteobacteria bacterium ST_bin14]|nr:MAG: cytochrome C [Proteobacteria bacterium ST_bin14]
MHEGWSAAPQRPSGRPFLVWAVTLFAIIIVGAVMYMIGLRGGASAPTARVALTPALPISFTPPPDSAIPDGPSGAAIRRGQQLFLHTRANAGNHVGNGLSCSNCHLDAGRQPNASPMWAAWGAYPAYRAKNDQINTMEDRIRDCFTYSMNAPASPSGKAPPPGDPIYRDLQMYFFWLAKGAPTGVDLPGRGFIDLNPTTLGQDPARGAKVFTQSCAVCHGVDGQGQRDASGSYAFPPLWGPMSFNWGAGVGKVANAAAFIKANMPLGQGYSLTDQQAWDVAAYISSRERPRDPRQTGSIEEARKRFHAKGDYYGQRIDGDLLGDGIATVR